MTSSPELIPCGHPGCERSFPTRRGVATHRRSHKPAEPAAPVAPAPPRPLRLGGLDLWNKVHETGRPSGSLEALLILCEQLDERSALRLRVIQHNDAKDRAGLRALEDQIVRGLRDIGLTTTLPIGDAGPADWTQEDN